MRSLREYVRGFDTVGGSATMQMPGNAGRGRASDVLRRWRPRRVLVLGGARSGKSRFAEELVGGRDPVEYVACGAVPDGSDPEWTARIDAHRRRRPSHWRTLETRDLEAVLGRAGREAGDGPVLVDCLSTWLAGEMDDAGIWDEADGADAALGRAIDALVSAWTDSPRRVVAVSNEVGSGVVPATASGRRYRDELGVLNTRIAAGADAVWLVTAGIGQRLK